MAALVAIAACRPAGGIERAEGFAQGTTYAAQWVSADVRGDVAAALEAELARIDALLSNYRADSAIERFNAERTTARLDVPEEIVALVRAAERVHAASDGCFDPTIRPLVALWGFDGPEPSVPETAAIAETLGRVGLSRVHVLGDTALRKDAADVEVDVSGIAQGYTADRLAAVLESLGSERYLVEIGGEIIARGRKPDGAPWRVAIETPQPASGTAAIRVLTLPDERSAVATSGTYQHFFSADGRRYAHVLDPRTGRPVEHALVSATVLHTDGALADAWSTALLCLGPDDAMRVATDEGLAAILFVERDGVLSEWRSPLAAVD